MCPIGEKTEIFINIYNKQLEKFISEDFKISLSENGVDVNKIGKYKTIFIVFIE